MLFKSRFVDIVSNMNDYSFHILGCGAIGSSTATQLARTGAENLYLYDMDIVSIENVGVSHYIISDVSKNKVHALKNHILNIDRKSVV